MFKTRRIVTPFLVPVLLITTSALLLWKWPGLLKTIQGIQELRAFLTMLPVLPYAVFAAGVLMGWRYNNLGLLLAFAVLALGYWTLFHADATAAAANGQVLSIVDAVGCLLPLNLALFSTLTRRRIWTAAFLGCVLPILLQMLFVLLICTWPGAKAPLLPVLVGKIWPTSAAPCLNLTAQITNVFYTSPLTSAFPWLTPVVLAFCGTQLFLLGRFVYGRDLLAAGFSSTLLAVFLAGTASRPVPAMPLYFTVAGMILIVATIDVSMSMAYVDELTGLQGRRRLNETLLNLGLQYAIAMIDVDHFKKFNDTYGHKTGDQVLKMIGGRLAGISGGGRTYRYGGEEFTAVFSGKTAKEIRPHLESFRESVAATPFVVRSRGRRKGSPQQRGSLKPESRRTVQVTVSIGVASSASSLRDPEKVLKKADRLLYRAKRAGRNRVVTDYVSGAEAGL